MKKYFLFFLMLSTATFAQQAKIDSLISVLNANTVADTNRVKTLLKVEYLLRLNRNFTESKKNAIEGLDISTKLNYTYGILGATRALALTERQLNNLDQSIALHQKLYTNFQKDSAWKTQYNFIYFNTLSDLAICYLLQGNFLAAQQFGIEGLSDAEKNHNYLNIASICGTLGNIARGQVDYKTALYFYQQMLLNYEKAKDDSGVASSLSAIATSYADFKNFDKAVEFHRRALEMYQLQNDKINIRRTLGNLSANLKQLKKLDEAENAIEKALALADTTDKASMVFLQSTYISILIEKGLYTNAINYAKRSIYFAQQSKQLPLMRIAYLSAIRAYMANKDTTTAYIFLDKLSVVKDSLFSSETLSKTNALTKKYETEKKEQEIISLNKENALKQKQLEQEILLSKSLQAENLTKQQLLQKEKLLSIALEQEVSLKEQQMAQELQIKESLERENALKNIELSKEIQLTKSLETQNLLMKNNSKNEKIIRWLLLIGLVGLSVFVVWFYRSFQKQKLANTLIEKQAEDLKFLMKEVHHRVKNNLQMVSAMLRMQGRAIGHNHEATNALQAAEERLKAIALLHEKLYKTNAQEMVNMADYINELTQIIAQHSKQPGQHFEYFIQDNAKFKTNLDTALPIGLLVNEIINNAFKHAFKGASKPIIWMELNKQNTHVELKIKDNGPGLPNNTAIKSTGNLGFKLMHLFAEQLNGTLSFHSNNGAEFKLSFEVN